MKKSIFIVLCLVLGFVFIAGTAYADDLDDGLLEFSVSPAKLNAGDTATLFIRFVYSRRPVEGSLNITITDLSKNTLKNWREGVDFVGVQSTADEWQVSVNFEAEVNMQWVRISWLEKDDDGDIDEEDEELRLNIGSNNAQPPHYYDFDDDILEFSASPSNPDEGDNVTLLARFRYSERPVDGSVKFIIVDASGKILKNWQEGNEFQGERVPNKDEWVVSVNFTAEANMYLARVIWLEKDDDGDIDTEDEKLRLNIGKKSGVPNYIADDGLLEFSVSPTNLNEGDNATIFVRFFYSQRPVENSLNIIITDSSGRTVKRWREGTEITGERVSNLGLDEWKVSMNFTAEADMYWAYISWLEIDDNEIDTEGERLRLRVGTASSDKKHGGLVSYDVTENPFYSGDTMETRALFNVRPDIESVKLKIEDVDNGSSRTIDPNGTVQVENYYSYKFKFDVFSGILRTTLLWSASNEEYEYTEERDIRLTEGNDASENIQNENHPEDGSSSGSGGGGCVAWEYGSVLLTPCLFLILQKKKYNKRTKF